MLVKHKFEPKERIQGHEDLQSIVDDSTSYLTTDINYQRRILGVTKTVIQDSGEDS